MTARQIAAMRRIERRVVRLAVGMGGLLLVAMLVPIVARWTVG